MLVVQAHSQPIVDQHLFNHIWNNCLFLFLSISYLILDPIRRKCIITKEHDHNSCRIYGIDYSIIIVFSCRLTVKIARSIPASYLLFFEKMHYCLYYIYVLAFIADKYIVLQNLLIFSFSSHMFS